MILRNWHVLLAIISFSALLSAFVAEYIFGLQPCDLCLKQRHPYYFILLIIFIIFFIPNFYKLMMYILIQLAVIYGIFYSVWHVGVENQILKGPAGCSAGFLDTSSINDLKEQILSRQVVSCDEIIWSFFGLSAASLNTIVLLFIFIINGLYILQNYVKKEKN